MNRSTVRNSIVGALVAGALATGIATVGAQSSTNSTSATSVMQTIPGVATPPAVPTSTGTNTNVPGVPTPPATQDQHSGPPAPPVGGPSGGPEAMVGTESGAARDLQHAYRSAGDYVTLVGTSSASSAATSLFESAKSYYTQALAAYNAGKYTQAHNYAEASSHASGAAIHLVRADRGTTVVTVPGLTAPPTTSDATSQEKAARELNHAYETIGRAVSVGSTDQTVAASIATSKSLYQTALDEYNAQKYDAASERAHAAADAADAGLNYAQTLSN